MKSNKKRYGFSLVECMVALLLLAVSSTIFITFSIQNLKSLNYRAKIKEYLNEENILINEIKYNTKICDIKNNIKSGNNLKFEYKDIKKLINTNIFNINRGNEILNEYIKIQLIEEKDGVAKMKISYLYKINNIKYEGEKEFEKYYWMEKM